MAFNVYFKSVINDSEVYTKANPWRCDICNKKDEVLIRGKIDYDSLVLCKECLLAITKQIEEKEKELNEGNSNIQPKKS